MSDEEKIKPTEAAETAEVKDSEKNRCQEKEKGETECSARSCLYSIHFQ